MNNIKNLEKGNVISQEVIDNLHEDINVMISFAAENGIVITPDVNGLIQNFTIDNLLQTYNILVKNVYPATPKSIKFYKEIASHWKDKNFFSRMPVSKNLLFLSTFFLLFFIITSSSSMVNMNSLDKGVLNNEGVSLLLNLAYLFSISGLGVMFYLLKNINTAIRSGTIVPEDSTYYPIVIFLGLISGLIMSEVFSLQSFDDKSSGLLFNKSLLALIGGFSSDVIFSILYNTINKIKSKFEF